MLQLPTTQITGRKEDGPAEFVNMDSACPSNLFPLQPDPSWSLSSWDPAVCVIYNNFLFWTLGQKLPVALLEQ